MMTFSDITWLNLLCLTGVGVYLVKTLVIKKNLTPYPPGSRGWPLIGNILDMPRIKPWVIFTKWGEMYGECLPFRNHASSTVFSAGDITHIQVMGRHIIVLNSVKTAMEMMDNKSILYSERPVLPMSGELVGWKDSLPFLPYGDLFRQQCKNLHRVIGSRAAVGIYNEIGEAKTHQFLKCVLAKPDQLQGHVRQYVSFIFAMTLTLS
jgi:hypothetical protein